MESSEQISDIVNELIGRACKEAVDAIHFHPWDGGVDVSFRKYGNLTLEQSFSDDGTFISNCLKGMCCLDLNEHSIPQDGRIYFMVGEHTFELREVVVPTSHGEKIVLNIMPSMETFTTLDSLCMNNNVKRSVKEVIDSQNGFSLFCGLRRSGLSTTLHAIACHLSATGTTCMVGTSMFDGFKVDGSKNIVFIKTKARRGFTIAMSVKYATYADIDTIIIEEIDCFDTAAAAIKAAQRGFRVIAGFSSLNCKSALLRLLDMGVVPTSLIDSLKLVVAQNLTPKKCIDCGSIGCDVCSKLGFIGWSPHFEAIEMNYTIRELLRSENPRIALQNHFASGN